MKEALIKEYAKMFTEKVAVIDVFGIFVVGLFKYTGVPVTAVVTTLPPDDAS